MICKFKSLALLVTALLALYGLASPAAGAHSPAKFTSESNQTTITGESHGAFILTATGTKIECGIAKIHGTAEGTSPEEVTLIPTLTECVAFGFVQAKLTGFGHYGEKESCHLVLHAAGTGDLVCPPGMEVTLDAQFCTVHMPPQKGVKGFSFAKIKREGKDALTVNANIDNLHGFHTDDGGFFCPFGGSSTFTNTKASGSGVVWGEDPLTGAPVGISWDETTP